MVPLPARTLALLTLVSACVFATGCSTSTSGDPLDDTSATATGAGASGTPSAASPTATLPPGQFETLALDALSPGAAGIARSLGSTVGVAVVVPSEQRIYQYNAEPQFQIESVIKLPIMLTVMDQAIEVGRVITDEETGLIEAMITQSDNDATTTLWNEIGGASAVEEYLQGLGITGFTLLNENWGESTMSAVSAARLMARVIGGETLDKPHRDFALELLTHIDPVQDWGAVVAGQFEGVSGVKNGWYPEYEGWALASVGYVVPESDRPVFTIAIFTDEWVYFGEAVNAIESIGGLVNTALSER